MRSVLIVVILLLVGTTLTYAQTETPTPEPSVTPQPYVYATVAPLDGTPEGQMTRFDYVATAADVHIANLLTMQLLSQWGMFLFTVLFLVVIWRRR